MAPVTAAGLVTAGSYGGGGHRAVGSNGLELVDTGVKLGTRNCWGLMARVFWL